MKNQVLPRVILEGDTVGNEELPQSLQFWDGHAHQEKRWTMFMPMWVILWYQTMSFTERATVVTIQNDAHGTNQTCQRQARPHSCQVQNKH